MIRCYFIWINFKTFLVKLYKTSNTFIYMNKIDKYLKSIENLSLDEKIIKTFEFVQKIPYRVCKFESIDELITNNFGDCRHKHSFLFEVYSKLGLKVEKIIVLFDWKDLPIPNEKLEILKKSGTIFPHEALYLFRDNKKILVDATWEPRLEKIGFPITKKWDGKSNTKNITDNKVENLSLEEYKAKKKNLGLVREEILHFADEINDFLKEN